MKKEADAMHARLIGMVQRLKVGNEESTVLAIVAAFKVTAVHAGYISCLILWSVTSVTYSSVASILLALANTVYPKLLSNKKLYRAQLCFLELAIVLHWLVSLGTNSRTNTYALAMAQNEVNGGLHNPHALLHQSHSASCNTESSRVVL